MTAPRVNPPAIDTTLRLPDDQYYPEPQDKSVISLHHTVGGSATSTFDWWLTDPARVGTAYIVARDGTVHEVFPPECWAYQFGVKGADLERRAIGIELASEGALAERDGILYAFDGQRRLGWANDLESQGRAERHDWRGYRWFDAYDERQVTMALRLVVHLCERFAIPKQCPLDADLYGPADRRRWWEYRGVVHHVMFRADKSDLHPGFPWHRLRMAFGTTSLTPQGA